MSRGGRGFRDLRGTAPASQPHEIFAITGAAPLLPSPLQLGQAWMGELDGEAYGIVTGPIGLRVGPMTSRERLVHSLILAIQGFFLSEEFVELMDTTPVDLHQIFDELTWLFTRDADEARTTIEVEGMAVDCEWVTYRGVTFAAGCDVERWPFTVARSASVATWPTLQRVLADR